MLSDSRVQTDKAKEMIGHVQGVSSISHNTHDLAATIKNHSHALKVSVGNITSDLSHYTGGDVDKAFTDVKDKRTSADDGGDV